MARWAVAALLLALAVAPAQALLGGGTYVATGPVTTSRLGATLTLLQNGKVLIAGQGSAELYDPATGTWSATGIPNAVREHATATLLQNGKVLVAGGFTRSNGNVVATTELYDPATGTWTPSATMTSPRFVATATLLADGKVLIAGGSSANNAADALDSAELYDPASDTITATGSFVGSRFLPVSILLDNGKVLMTGGRSFSQFAIATSALYDPASGTWSTTGPLDDARALAPLVKLTSGEVLIAGGSDAGGNTLNAAEIYDPVNGAWSPAKNMLSADTQHSMVLLPSGQVLAAGGTALASQVYDPALDLWTTSGLPAPHNSLADTGNAVLLGNGDVLFAPEDLGLVSELYRPVLPRTKTDFSGDGKSDIVFENGIGTRWLFNMNGAAVQTAQALPGAAPGWVLVGMGDFDSNGTTDMLWRNSADPTQHWIYLMNGPTIIGGGLVTVAPGFKPTYIADFDGDLKSDILWENSTGVRWFTFMSGAAVIGSSPVPGAAAGWEIAGVGDFNGDNRADLLWVNTATPTQYWIYLLNGSAVVGSGGVNVAAGYQPTWIGDMNRDGKADILWENGTNSRWVFTMDGAALGGAFSLPPAAAGWELVGVGDYDNVGGLDLLWQNSANPAQYWIYLLSTTGTLAGDGSLTVAPGYVPLTH